MKFFVCNVMYEITNKLVLLNIKKELKGFVTNFTSLFRSYYLGLIFICNIYYRVFNF